MSGSTSVEEIISKVALLTEESLKSPADLAQTTVFLTQLLQTSLTTELKESGICRKVNNLRHAPPPVGQLAKSVVSVWKQSIAANFDTYLDPRFIHSSQTKIDKPSVNKSLLDKSKPSPPDSVKSFLSKKLSRAHKKPHDTMIRKTKHQVQDETKNLSKKQKSKSGERRHSERHHHRKSKSAKANLPEPDAQTESFGDMLNYDLTSKSSAIRIKKKRNRSLEADNIHRSKSEPAIQKFMFGQPVKKKHCLDIEEPRYQSFPSDSESNTSISAKMELAKPSTNYLPPPTVNSSKTASKKNDDIIAAKVYSRTQVFAGKRKRKRVEKLFDLCVEVLLQNIDSIEYVGGIPAHVLMPVLTHCSPAQLFTIEHYNPHFIGDTEQLWEKHCRRDFSRDITDNEQFTWRDRYVSLFDKRERKFKVLAETLSKGFLDKPSVRQTQFTDKVHIPRRRATEMIIPSSVFSPHGHKLAAGKTASIKTSFSPSKEKRTKPRLMQSALKLYRQQKH